MDTHLSSTSRWRPMCLYYTQGKCTMMDDPAHLEKFNHDCSWDLQVNAAEIGKKCTQGVDYLLVFDLEGKIETLEFPVLLIDTRSLAVVNFFHRFVRPCQMHLQAINKYIEGKYGKLGVDRVWHDTAQPFKDVIEQFETWLTQHQLWDKEKGGFLTRAAFVTCGNWDLKTAVPKQCEISQIKLPPYFMEWINLKDVYLNFYGREARGMMSMMNQLNIRPLGSHHLGIDDSKNIARVLQHMLADGAVMQITARRNPTSQKVEYQFENRIRSTLSILHLDVNYDYARNSYLNSPALTFDYIDSIQMTRW
ncbi:Exonuclease [Corchorus capsularis]|uniref:Exonuclease n=1 Tax=Corchorus capsularis TaxID=210143 RepID=A0A1R3HX37_COCAP|nr:Exonuclease [Corchorus capsularis]